MDYLQLDFSNCVKIVLAILATYRLARLFQKDDGPFNLIDTARQNAAIRAGNSRLWETVAELYSCQYCLGVWFAALCVALLIRPTAAGDLFLLWMGLSGAQSFLEAQ